MEKSKNKIGLRNVLSAVGSNFMEDAPLWYKSAIGTFLLINPFLFVFLGPYVTGWMVMAQFIFTLVMTTKGYPLVIGGAIALEALALGMTRMESIYLEVEHNFAVIFLVAFMVPGVSLLRELLLLIFSTVLVKVSGKLKLSLFFHILGGAMSAFFDALTVCSMVLTVLIGFFGVYHKFASRRGQLEEHDETQDDTVHEEHKKVLYQFRAFLRSLLMHFGVGTTVGGLMTKVGEPQNVVISDMMSWNFGTFAEKMAPFSIAIAFSSIMLCFALERWPRVGRLFGHGTELPNEVLAVLRNHVEKEHENRDARTLAKLINQGMVAVFIIFALGLHIAEPWFIGLIAIVILGIANGVIQEGRIGHLFLESMPFVALILIFFVVIGVIHDQQLFAPFIAATLAMEGKQQLMAFYSVSGLLSAISDNVFVATTIMMEARSAYEQGLITILQYEKVAIAINAGTNIPSIFTPNGQAAFLFILTHAIAGRIKLGYIRMFMLSLPYFLVLTPVGAAVVWFLL